MTTLAELESDVLVYVRRPDLSSLIQSQLKNTILKLHTKDYWKRDIVESNFNFATPAAVYSFEYKLTYPNFRKPKYLNTVDPVTFETVRMVSPVDITETKDRYGRLKDYTFYLAGDNMQIRVSDEARYFGLGYYKYPDVTLTEPSWIVDEHKDCVIYDACRSIFLSIGYQEQSAGMRELYNEAYAALLASAIPDEGE